MKKIKTLILSLAIVATAGIASASGTKDDYSKYTIAYAVNTYIDAMSHGKLDALGNVLDNDVKFDLIQGHEFVSYSKSQMLDYMQQLKDINYDCSSSATLLQGGASVNVYRVDMQFDGFTRSNYVTLSNKGKGWKIINVYSVFN